MSDLISRQAAIDALDEIESEVADGYGYQYEKWRKYFCGLPSAQPEIIRCGECKHCYIDGENVRFNVCELNHNKAQSDDWYCADAERRTDDKTNKSSSC